MRYHFSTDRLCTNHAGIAATKDFSTEVHECTLDIGQSTTERSRADAVVGVVVVGDSYLIFYRHQYGAKAAPGWTLGRKSLIVRSNIIYSS